MSGNDLVNICLGIFVLYVIWMDHQLKKEEKLNERKRQEEVDRKLKALLSCSRCGRELGIEDMTRNFTRRYAADTCNDCAAKE